MKTLLPGPRLDDVVEREGLAFFIKAIGASIGPTVDGRYRHWDSLRDLTDLMQRGLVERSQQGRKYTYRLAADVEADSLAR